MKEVTVRRGRRRKQLLGDLKEKGGYRKLKEEALDRSLWKFRFGRDSVLSQGIILDELINLNL
jgi:hypothetical protein